LKHLFNIKEAACAAVIVRPKRVAVSSRAVNESSPRGPGSYDSCGVHTRARTRRVPLTPESGPSAVMTPGGVGESSCKRAAVFPTSTTTLRVSGSPPSLRFVSRFWKGYRIPPGYIKELVEER
jgi:hypothetical protein